MYLENLINLKDQDLLTHFSLVVQKERETIATVVSYLSEIDRRKLYLKEAYSSLFSFVTQKFNYSEGAAYRRIQASKVNQLFPEVLELLSKGKVSLMTLSLMEPYLTKENGKELIEKIIGKSKREVEGILSGLFGKEEKESHKDIIRRLPIKRVKIEQGDVSVKGNELFQRTFTSENTQTSCPRTFTGESTPCSSATGVSETFTGGVEVESPKSRVEEQAVRRIKIEFVAEEGLAGKIERAKEILRHKFPEGKFEDIFNQALDDMLEKRDPNKKIERVKKRKAIREAELGERSKIEGRNAPETIKRIHKPKEIKQNELNERGKENTPEKSEKFLSRYISQEIKRKVWERDGGQCAYESRSGKRCEARGFLQYDHVQPWALWGESTEENLRLLCAQHNRWRAQSTFF